MHPPSFDIQGHRGARGLYPENTIPGFLAALEIGVTTLEMDVVISADRRVVVSHEPWFSRTICVRPDGRRIPFLRQRRYRLFEMSYDEISRFDCGSLRHPDFSRQQSVSAPKPLLQDVIDECERWRSRRRRLQVYYSIETKSRPVWDGVYHPDPDTFARLLLDVLAERDVVERTIVQSFDVRTLQSLKRMNQVARLSLLVDRKQAGDVDRNLEVLGFVPSIYSPRHDTVDRELIDRVRRRGLGIIPWTVNDPLRMAYLYELGVDGFITDYPDVAVGKFMRES